MAATPIIIPRRSAGRPAGRLRGFSENDRHSRPDGIRHATTEKSRNTFSTIISQPHTQALYAAAADRIGVLCNLHTNLYSVIGVFFNRDQIIIHRHVNRF
jgi:hypothetical protein